MREPISTIPQNQGKAIFMPKSADFQPLYDKNEKKYELCSRVKTGEWHDFCFASYELL
jgi:hypothetical protein